MPCDLPFCLRKCDFDRIAYYARMRYVEGCSTMQLMLGATNDSERKHIALATLLDLDDAGIRDFMPLCSEECLQLLFEFRDRLRVMIAGLKSAAAGRGKQHAA